MTSTDTGLAIRTSRKNLAFRWFLAISKPGKRSLGTRNFKWLYRAHLFAGLFVSVHGLVLFLSGALLLFKNEIQSLAKAPVVATETVPRRADLYDAVLRDVRARFPADRPLSFALDEENPDILQIRLGMNGAKEFRGARRLTYDARTAEPVERVRDDGGFFAWLLELHRDLLLGANGKLYVGFVGLVFLFTLISGAFIYGGFMKKVSFGEIRRLTWRTVFSDLHKFVGMSVLFWGLLIGATGTLLAFNSTLLKIYQSTELKELNRKYQGGEARGLASLDRVVEAAQAAKPEGVASFIAFPDTQFSVPNHFIVLMRGREGFSEKLIDLVIVDAASGAVNEVRELPLYLKTLVLSEPLHFGDYGGLPLKILWLAFTLMLLMMPISGLIIFYQRKKKRAPVALPAARTPSRPSRRWSHPFLLPGVFFLMTALAVTTALFGEGAVDAFAAAIGLPPILFLLAMIRLARNRGAASETEAP